MRKKMQLQWRRKDVILDIRIGIRTKLTRISSYIGMKCLLSHHYFKVWSRAGNSINGFTRDALNLVTFFWQQFLDHLSHASMAWYFASPLSWYVNILVIFIRKKTFTSLVVLSTKYLLSNTWHLSKHRNFKN